MKNSHTSIGLLSLANVCFLLANVIKTDWFVNHSTWSWVLIMAGYVLLALGFFFLYKTYKSE